MYCLNFEIIKIENSNLNKKNSKFNIEDKHKLAMSFVWIL